MGLSRACLLFVFHSVTAFSADLTSECQCPENVNCGNSTKVRCYFSEDVFTLAKSFIVVKFPIDAAGKEDILVYCSSVNKTLDCDVADGYRLRPEPGAIQTLQIANATRKDEGRYACQYLTSKPQTFHTCILRVQEANLQDDSKTVKENFVDREGDQEKDRQGGDTSARNKLSPVALVIIIAACVALVVIVPPLIVFRKQIFRSSMKPRPASENEAEAANGQEEKEILMENRNPQGNANLSSNGEEKASISADNAAPNGSFLPEETTDEDLQQKPKISNDSCHQSSDSSVDGNEDATQNVATWTAFNLRITKC